MRFFGQFVLLVDGEDQSRFINSKKTEELIAYLFCQEGAFVAKKKIGEALWEELEPKQAMNNFYKIYMHLRHCIEQGLPLTLENIRGKLRLLSNGIESDCMRFTKLCEGGSTQWEEAVQLYRAPLLAEEYYAWTDGWAARYDIEYLKLLEKLIEAYQVNGDNGRAAVYQKLYNLAAEL